MLRRLFAEFLGTFGLVFAGTGAVIVNELSHGTISHCGVALVFGLAVLSMICCFGDVSGAHLNPAVSVAFAATGRLEWSEAIRYAGAQIAGAVSASSSLHLLFPASGTLGATLPAGSAMQSFVLELVLTFFLMLVILAVATGAKDRGPTAAIAVGSVVALEALFGGPVSGASMNPARSVGPALISGHLNSLWIYLLAPTAGALLAVPACCLLRGRECCSQAGKEALRP